MTFFRRRTTVTPTPTPTPAPVPAPVVGIPTKIYGVATDTTQERDAFNTAAGKPVNVFSIYKSFYWDAIFPSAEVNAIHAAGYVPMITWEPWEPNGNATQPIYSLAAINRGDHDNIIKNWAAVIKTLPYPVLLRFAHEMNGNWYPWCVGVNGNTSQQYIDAWNRVRLLFSAAGVTNVSWVWSPNVDFPLNEWPGANNVDYIALDGYNWDTASPEQVFGPTLDKLATFQRPIFIGETGCPENSGKAAWISAFFTMVKNRGLVGFIWFNIKKEQDWRIQSSVAATNSFKANVSTF